MASCRAPSCPRRSRRSTRSASAPASRSAMCSTPATATCTRSCSSMRSSPASMRRCFGSATPHEPGKGVPQRRLQALTRADARWTPAATATHRGCGGRRRMGVKARPQALPGQEITVDEQRKFSVDGLLPSTVMRPNDADDAARDLHACNLAAAAVVVWGGGTQMRLGAPPRRYEVAFSTERMTRLLEHQPADLTCRVEAGMRLRDLQATLRAKGQRLPLDPPHPERATVGGMVAANTNGLSRGRYGTVRDWVIGIAVAYPTGKVARAGGKVVKNVAGYDLMKLHIGALGTLGVVAEVNFKVQARPEGQATLLGHFETAGPALDAGLQLARTFLAPAASIVLDRRALWECGITADWPWTLALK